MKKIINWIRNNPFLVLILPLLLLIIIPPVAIESLYIFNYKFCWVLFIREYGKLLFGSKETMWVAITGVVTATGIVATILLQQLNKIYKELKLRESVNMGLKHEVKNNFNAAFVPNVYIPFENSIYNLLKQNYQLVKDFGKLNTIITLYNVMSQYNRSQIALGGDRDQLLKYKYELALSYLGFLRKKELLKQQDEEKIGKVFHRIENLEYGRVTNMTQLQIDRLLPREYEQAIKQFGQIYLDYREKSHPLIEGLIDEIIK